MGPGGRRSPVFPEAGDQRRRDQVGGPQRPAPVDGRLQQSVPDTEVGATRRATSDRPCEAGAPYQQNGQQPTGDNIECQAETGPPHRDARILNEQTMKKVENTVSSQSRDNEPEILLEPRHRNNHKRTRHQGLDQEGMYGRSYDRKQNVICGDDDQQGWVENTVAVKSNE